MAILSLNTSITSSHKDDFYTGVFIDGNNYPWAVIYNLYGNYFTDPDSLVPCEDMIIYGRTNISQNWKELGRSNMCGYYGYCYMYFTQHYGFWYNFNNSSDPDNYQFFDKVRVDYGGMSAESFINRTTLNIHTLDINNNIIGSAPITISCYSNCGSYQNPNINVTSDIFGHARATYFNPPKVPGDPEVYRIYRINAAKDTLIGYKDEIIPNQQYYPSESTYVNVQLLCPTTINSNLVVI